VRGQLHAPVTLLHGETSQILEKKWEYNETVYQLFTDFRKAYGSIRRKYCPIFS
jgi:hypothetical protein